MMTKPQMCIQHTSYVVLHIFLCHALNLLSITHGLANHKEKSTTIWENPPHVAQGNFAERNKIILKLLCFSLFVINFDNMLLWM